MNRQGNYNPRLIFVTCGDSHEVNISYWLSSADIPVKSIRLLNVTKRNPIQVIQSQNFIRCKVSFLKEKELFKHPRSGSSNSIELRHIL